MNGSRKKSLELRHIPKYNSNVMNNWIKPTLEDLGDASRYIMGAQGSNQKDDFLNDGFEREGISIGQS